MKFALSGARIFDGFQIHEDTALLVNNEKIVGVTLITDIPDDFELVELEGGLLAPGFIDLQINGAGGVQFNNAPSVDTLETMANAMAPFGVTRILPTIITDDPEITRQAIESAMKAEKQIAGILGIHVEGPFFSPRKNGVHQLEKIRKISKDDWSWLDQLANIPSILTLAPEQVSTQDITKLVQRGIRICAGHTNAKYKDILSAHHSGLSGFTHLFNAMRPMTGREPGVVGAALSMKNTWAGMIADGIHVHDASMKLAINAKDYEKIFLVSDAMATAGSDTKFFELYGETIQETDGRLVNSEGKLAGSAITLHDAVKYCITQLNLPEEHVLAMASRVPAEYMQLQHLYGSFKTDCLADICLLNDDLSIRRVWQAGNEINLL
jgi:N-acetylglucosamine-6-phosphate deacetylase